MAGGDPSPSPPASPSPAKHRRRRSRDDDEANPDASPKRRRHKHHHHRRSHRHRHADDDPLPPAAADVEEGEILDDVAAAAVSTDLAAPQAAAPDLSGADAVGDSAVEAAEMHAPRLPSRSPSRDEHKSAPDTESGGIFSSDAEHGQMLSKSPELANDKGRKRKDENHRTLSSNKDSHTRVSPSKRHHAGVHHSRSGEADARANNGVRASPRDESDDRNGFDRHSTRTRRDERERSSSRVVRDGHGDRRDSRERYRDERRHSGSAVDRDSVDRRHRERSSSHSRPERRESARHTREESRERERWSGSSRHSKDHERRDASKDSYKEYDTAGAWHERDKGRDDRDRGRHRDMESETRRAGAGERKDRVISNSDRHRDLARSRYSTSDVHKDRSRSGDKGRDADSRSQRSRDEQSLKEEDEEDYQEKIEQQLAMQEEDDPEKIKEEARRRKEAIMAKYRQQQMQKQQLESSLPKSNDEEVRAVDRNEAVDEKDVNDSNSMDNEEAENKLDSSDAFAGEVDFTVVKSPAHGTVSSGAEALLNEGTTGVSGLGEGTPKSERSADMFCDDIFGESPAGFRKLDKGDGLCIEKNALHDNWDDPEGYYTHRFGELLDGRYEITAAHGKGVFSTVVRAKDLKAGKDDPEVVAIKIIRKNETMYKAGKQEVSILEKLASADREDRRHCVRFISSFMYRNHLCLVFESLNMNLREVLKKFGRNIGLKLTAVRAYSKQLFIALKHLKNCKVLHCDIKPDNMLVNDAKNVLKLCDFGNAMLAGMNEVTPYLVSRFYRAPEIILGLPYDHPLDIWSVGCCLYELSTGKVLFPGATNNDILRLHMELKGPFPKKMLKKGAFTMQHFDQDLNFNAIEEDPVTKKPMRKLILNIKPKDFGSLVSNFPGEDPRMLSNFKDLLEKIFILDPDKRITVSQALSHPFITGK
ncbi:uncharacterized protein [Lolium perenne]|uniref:uncharacterized protein isoform X1 n=2 Tax=Lolium perenne TaxID=4522 RepID=UPI0021EA0E52|nr:uncharacterized protein LOC127298980 isoform X1 [Lolium perenne]